ncbi:MAG: oligosaccharide flippase family protein [Butyrivibrio sp.]|nr:oligosaccharide flippase family protein [Butyrivibrio sp.]
MSKKTFIKGTFILTAAGVATKLLGFVFRILLSRNIGAEGMGIYQLVMPVSAVCFAIGISGLEVSVSRFTAYYCFRQKKAQARSLAVLCTAISLLLCLVCAVSVYFLSGALAAHVFHNPSCAPLIRITAVSVPFACIHCMVCSYYIGREKAGIPALSQLFEQLIRIGTVYIMIKIYKQSGEPCSAVIGAAGLIAGEIGAALFCLSVIMLHTGGRKTGISRQSLLQSLRTHARELSGTAIPVSLNRLSLHGLQSVEAALIPLMLRTYGLSSSEALSVYGIITGMAMPIILFPCTLSNSVAQMLLPSMSKLRDEPEKLRRGGLGAIVFSVCFGFACIIAFITVGAPLGSYLFGEQSVADYVKILAWLCPFIFIISTFKSILHALGKTALVFANNMLSETINLACVVFLIPRFGIYAYLTGMLVSQLVNALLCVIGFYRTAQKISRKPVQS